MELYSGLGNLHSSTDVPSLARVEVVQVFFALHGYNVTILDSLQRHSGSSSFLVPYFEVFGRLLLLLLPLLLGFSSNKDLLLIRRLKRGEIILVSRSSQELPTLVLGCHR